MNIILLENSTILRAKSERNIWQVDALPISPRVIYRQLYYRYLDVIKLVTILINLFSNITREIK